MKKYETNFLEGLTIVTGKIARGIALLGGIYGFINNCPNTFLYSTMNYFGGTWLEVAGKDMRDKRRFKTLEDSLNKNEK